MTQRWPIAGLLAALAGLPTPAKAQLQFLPLVLCRAVAADAERLACFDKAMQALLDSSIKTPTEPPDRKWMVRDSRSPIDDSAQYDGTLLAQQGEGMLMLRCRERKTEAAYSAGRFLTIRANVPVIYRIDDQKPIESRWPASTDGKAAFVPNAVQFTRSLPNGGKLFIRATTHSGDQYDSTFILNDLDEVRDRIAEACKWPASRGAKPEKRPVSSR